MVAVGKGTTLQFNMTSTGQLLPTIANCVSKIKSGGIAKATARADAAQARDALIKDVCARLDSLTSRMDGLVSRIAEDREAQRAANAAQRVLDEEPITSPPGTEVAEPTGDLHTLQAKTDEPDAEGDLPEELQEPPDPVPPPKGSVQPQPTAISLNED